MQRLLVWDAPTRVIHWLVAICVLVAWLTRDARDLDLHAAAGYCALGLCVFRILWGFVGSRHARFREFAYSPREALTYLQGLAAGNARSYIGHNPAGSWSVHALLSLQLLVGATGLLAIGGMHALGPLAGFPSYELTDVSLWSHEAITWLMLGIIGLHVLGVIASSVVHRENLVASMLNGRKRAPADERPATPHSAVAGLLVAATVGGAGAYLWQAQAFEPKRDFVPQSMTVALDATWRGECESCHLPYAPCMLPSRSWRAMIDGQDRHFGEDLSLAGDMQSRLKEIAARPRSAEPWACWKTRESISSLAAPLRITQAPYWRESHARLAPADFKPPRSNGAHDCGACHRDAASSIFHPRMIHIAQ